MNILLTNSPAPERSPFYLDEKKPPLGIGFLIATLRQRGHRVFFLDSYLQSTDFLDSGYLQENKIDFIGISVNTVCLTEAVKLLHKTEQLRKHGKWSGKIIVGGPHPSVLPETIPGFVDHIIIGEGEQSIVRAVEEQPERIIKADKIKDLDSLPSPPWDEFLRLPYQFTSEWISAAPVITMNTSRGCPFDCTFCSVRSVWGRSYRTFSAERIVEDISYLVKTHGVKGIYFREDNFTLNRQRVEEMCEILQRKKLMVSWMCESRVDTLDRHILRTMKRAGCAALYVGVESGSQRMLDFLNKGTRLEQIVDIFQICRTLEIKTCASFIVGMPTETDQERAETMAFKERLQPSKAWFNVFVGIPQSPLYFYTLKNRLYEYIDDCGLVYLPGHDRLVDQFYGGDPRRKIPQHLFGRAKAKINNLMRRMARN